MQITTIVTAAALAVGLASGAYASPEFWRLSWPQTDFETTTVENWSEIMSGGPPKDGIPAVDDPSFITVAEESRIPDPEPVITLEIDGQTPRAYPIRYLMWHEIVNDQVGEVPVSVTFCPLCNSGMTFDRRIEQGVISFGVSGMLRNSDMVMYDRETESWWQQAIGTGIVGALTGVELEQLPSWMESYGEFAARNPEGLVMDQPRFARSYGRNPYMGYDGAARPFLYNGEMPPHGVHPLARVVRIGDAAWPVARLVEEGPVTQDGYTLSWASGQASALDHANIAKGRDVGTVRVRDASGADVPHDVLFAFAFHAFWPEGDWKLN